MKLNEGESLCSPLSLCWEGWCVGLQGFLCFCLFFFNWRIIALQNFVVFCQTSTWISHRYTYIPFVFCLVSLLFSWSFGHEESSLFLWAFLFVSFGVFALPASPVPSLGYIWQKENPGNSLLCRYSGPEVTSWSAFIVLPFRVFSSHACLTYSVQDF